MSARRSVPSFVLAIVTSILVAACGQTPPRSEVAVSVAPEPPVKLYVSDETGGAIVVVDPAAGKVLERIAVGKRPRGLKVSRDHTKLYVALSGSPIAGPGVDEASLPPGDRSADGIGVVDLITHKTAPVLPSGQDPESFDLSPDGSTLYVSNEETAEMSVLDLATGKIRSRVKVGEEPEGVTVRPDGKFVYVTCEEDSEVVAVDTATLKVVARMKTGARPRSVVFTPDGATGFVASENGGVVSVIDTTKHAVVSTIKIPQGAGPTPARPMGTVLSPDGKQVFVSLGRAAAVAIIDASTRALVKTIEGVGARPWGIDVSRDGKIYTANGSSKDVSVIDVASGNIKKITTDGSPWGVVAVEKLSVQDK